MKHQKDWYQDMVLYQIYPRSFKDGNGDGIGDLKGMIEKLDYLKDLGVTAVWLSPVFSSPNVDNGYDISDYRNIMEEFGTMEDWIVFRDGLHERGIAIIMDLVLNHSSDQHVWFQESRKSRDNAYSDYYIWRDPQPDGSAPNEWLSVFGGSAWEYVPERGQYYLHIFAKEQPDLNWDNPETKKAIFDIIRFWNELGVDGYRVDAISYLDKGLDGRAKSGKITVADACVNLEGTHKHIQDMIRETIKPDHLMTVGEVNIYTPEDQWNYTAAERGEFSMAIAFVPPIVEIQTWSPQRLKKDVRETYELLSGHGWWARFFSNHDKPRQVSLYGDDQKYWKESAKMLACYLHTLPGMPIIYQGEEIGMTNLVLPSILDYDDIQTKNTYDTALQNGSSREDAFAEAVLTSRDNARTPMQWDDSRFGGFTDGDSTWLKVNPNYRTINAASQIGDPDSVFSFYQKLIQLRKQNPVMIWGDYHQECEDDSRIIAYSRSYEGVTWLAVHNFSHEPVRYSNSSLERIREVIISNYEDPEIHGTVFEMKPYETAVFSV